jgi:hypothetical protein
MQDESFDVVKDVGEDDVAVEDEATCEDEGGESHGDDEGDVVGEVEQGDRLLTYLCRTLILITSV